MAVTLGRMSVAVRPLFEFDNSFVRDLTGLYEPWQAAPAPAPELLVLNEELAAELGVDADALRAPDGVAPSSSATPPSTGRRRWRRRTQAISSAGSRPASATVGRSCSARCSTSDGRRRDVHLKGSGRTPFARGGDGKAAVGPMLREYVIGEAMHALGIPTTRALAVVATGEQIARDTMLPGAVLVRVAASHLRVGTFQYAAAHDDPTLVRRLADYAIARHYPHAADAENPYLAFFEGVVDAQASLVARWMLVGFIHGVMNTDNMTISGETIDFGPCAFMDAFDPATVFSSIDHGGRYAYGNQPLIAQWNLARLAETLLPLFDADTDTSVALATEVLQSFTDRYDGYWLDGMRAKLGLADARLGDGELIDDLLALLHAQNSRLHFVLPGVVVVIAWRRRTGPIALRRTRRLRRVGRSLARPAVVQRRVARTRSRPRWTRSTPSTSRATTRSKRRWPRRPTTTWGRSDDCSTCSRSRSTNDPVWSPTRSRPRRASVPTARSAVPDPHIPARPTRPRTTDRSLRVSQGRRKWSRRSSPWHAAPVGRMRSDLISKGVVRDGR